MSQEDITVSIEDALRLNASCVAMSIFVGSKYEYQTIVNLGKLVNEAEKYGMPVLAVTAVGKELGKDARYLSLACRIAAEQGAHIVKTYYCDNFEKVVESCPVPIIVAGGKKIPERDALQLTYNAIKAGAVGLDMGRNIWQSELPVAMMNCPGNTMAHLATNLPNHMMMEVVDNGRELFFNTDHHIADGKIILGNSSRPSTSTEPSSIGQVLGFEGRPAESCIFRSFILPLIN